MTFSIFDNVIERSSYPANGLFLLFVRTHLLTSLLFSNNNESPDTFIYPSSKSLLLYIYLNISGYSLTYLLHVIPFHTVTPVTCPSPTGDILLPLSSYSLTYCYLRTFQIGEINENVPPILPIISWIFKMSSKKPNFK